MPKGRKGTQASRPWVSCRKCFAARDKDAWLYCDRFQARGSRCKCGEAFHKEDLSWAQAQLAAKGKKPNKTQDKGGAPLALKDGGADAAGSGEQQKVAKRELLEELRRRSGEGARPEVERDYLERLLERF